MILYLICLLSNRGFFYPSASIGFLFTNLEPVKNLKDILSFGKLRISAAQVGSAGGIYATRTVFSRGLLTNGFIPDFTFPFNGSGAVTQSNIFKSNDLTPQNINNYEFGFDLKFFNNKLGIDYTFYTSNSDNQIFDVPLPYSSGFTSRYANAGAIKGWGHEIILKINPINNDIIDWNFDINFTLARTKVTGLAEGVTQIQSGYQNFSSAGAYGRVGYLYPVIVGTTYLRDGKGNIIVGSDGMPKQGPVGVIKEITPDFDISFINSFRITKDVTVGFQIDWRQGGYIWSGTNSLGNNYGIFKQTENREGSFIIKGVKEDGTPNDIPISGIAGHQKYYNSVLTNITEAFVYETTFLRLREVTITYDLPKEWFKETFIESLSINLQGRNLWLWTKELPNIDPETSTSSGNGIGAFEYVGLPNTRAFGGGFKLNF